MGNSAKLIESVLNPIAESAATKDLLAARLDTLEGKTIGLVDNTKEHSKVFFDFVERTLRARFASQVTRYTTEMGIASEPEVLDKVVRECDAVIHGIGD